MAGIQQDVKFIGMDDTIEIWANDKVEATKMSSEEFGKALENIMGQETSPAERY
jgi:MraZ protein